MGQVKHYQGDTIANTVLQIHAGPVRIPVTPSAEMNKLITELTQNLDVTK